MKLTSHILSATSRTPTHILACQGPAEVDLASANADPPAVGHKILV